MKERHALLGMLLVSTAGISGCTPSPTQNTTPADTTNTATVSDNADVVNSTQTDATNAAAVPANASDGNFTAASVGHDAQADW